MRALIEGTHATTLAYRPSRPLLGADLSAGKGLPFSVVVEPRGEARGSEGLLESCQSRIIQDVVVTLRFDDPPLDVVIETSAHAFSSSFAVVQLELSARVAAAMGLPSKKATLSLTFDDNGVQGSIEPHDGCGLAVFPADARCPYWPEVDVDLDRERDGFRPRDALAAIDELRDVPLRWLDGSATTLSVSLVAGPDWACGPYYVDFCPERLTMPVTIRAVIAGGSAAVDLPAELAVEVSTEGSATEGICGGARTAGEIESMSISAVDVPVPASALPPSVWSPENGAAALKLIVFSTYAQADVIPLEFVDPGLTAPLDSSIDPALSACVFNPLDSYSVYENMKRRRDTP